MAKSKLKSFYNRVELDEGFLGGIITPEDMDNVRDSTFFRGIDLTRLLDFLGSQGKRRKRDKADLCTILGVTSTGLEDIDTGRRVVSWGDIKRVALWADLDGPICLNIILNGQKPTFINLDYSTIRMDISRIMRAAEMRLCNLEHVFGANWEIVYQRINRNQRKITAVELSKLVALTGIGADKLLDFCCYY